MKCLNCNHNLIKFHGEPIVHSSGSPPWMPKQKVLTKRCWCGCEEPRTKPLILAQGYKGERL